MARIRIQRLEKELTKLISNTILYKLRDKNIQSVTITSVKLTNDMSLARVYFTHLGVESDKKVITSLTRSSGFIKKQIADAKLMRRIPELIFAYDEIADNARQIEDILNKIRAEKDTEDADD
ncbi:MAG: 30S ribosome-binding factor RbfA [Candidatus Cloacimonetes bacterium]|nr:30S ribosome-binding factor RbfA [Candidatus Cloacimonadota bacterium]